MDTNLPVYKLRIKEDDLDKNLSVDYVGLVDKPAVMVNWLAFKEKIKFVSDEERRLIMGPLMIADMPIFRRDENMGDHYVIFDKTEIGKIAEKFFRNSYQSNFNLMHDPSMKVSGISIFQSIIPDKTMGIEAPEAFKEISEGSWIGVAKVNNDEIWNEYIKTGMLRGFSIEGFFNYEYASDSDKEVIDYVSDLARGIK